MLQLKSIASFSITAYPQEVAGSVSSAPSPLGSWRQP